MLQPRTFESFLQTTTAKSLENVLRSRVFLAATSIFFGSVKMVSSMSVVAHEIYIKWQLRMRQPGEGDHFYMDFLHSLTPSCVYCYRPR